MKRLGDFRTLYKKADKLEFADKFQNFRSVLPKNKTTHRRWSSIRGGMCMIIWKFTKANKKHIAYPVWSETSQNIMHWDVNNLYCLACRRTGRDPNVGVDCKWLVVTMMMITIMKALRKIPINYTLKKCSVLKIENNSTWVNFTHFREKTNLLALELILISSGWRV